VEAFDWKISCLRRGDGFSSRETGESNGLETDKPVEEAPAWVLDVPPVEEWTSFVDASQFNKRPLKASLISLEEPMTMRDRSCPGFKA
jgi:hypothetical protein